VKHRHGTGFAHRVACSFYFFCSALRIAHPIPKRCTGFPLENSSSALFRPRSDPGVTRALLARRASTTLAGVVRPRFDVAPDAHSPGGAAQRWLRPQGGTGDTGFASVRNPSPLAEQCPCAALQNAPAWHKATLTRRTTFAPLRRNPQYFGPDSSTRQLGTPIAFIEDVANVSPKLARHNRR
jgi:hypothetical protein